MIRIPWPLLIAVTLIWIAPARAEIYIDVSGGGDFPLAIPDLKELGKTHEVGPILANVMRRDLQASGWFKVMDSAAFLENPQETGLRTGEFNMDDWRTLDAAGLVKAGYEVFGKTISAEIRVYHVTDGTMILGDVIDGEVSDPQAMGHRLADLVIEAFTGEKGPFSGNVVCVADLTGNKEIYLVDFSGRATALTRNGHINLSPALNPGRSKVAYTSYKGGNPDLYVLDIATQREILLSNQPGINSGADWSPDGARIALTLSPGGDSEIYSINGTTGGGAARLTSNWGIDVSPDWSPDGSSIAFTSSRFGEPQVFVMNRSGGGVTQVTFGGSHNVSPVWSPEGNKIAFAGRDKGRFDIFVCDVDGSNLRRLTQSPGDDEDPTWSPDGRYIMFSSDREGGGKQLFIMTADGRNITRITDGRGSYTNPDW